jgi:quercetin dioxygenase-like cupin family protein
MNYGRFGIAQTFVRFVLLGVAVNAASVIAQPASTAPQPCVIQFSDTTTHYQPLLNGAPQTAGMEAGLVTLMPGQSGSQHSSKGYEEALVIISGEGDMVVSGGPTLKLRPNSIAYCPTQTVHQIKNTGADPLKYVYVAAQVAK